MATLNRQTIWIIKMMVSNHLSWIELNWAVDAPIRTEIESLQKLKLELRQVEPFKSLSHYVTSQFCGSVRFKLEPSHCWLLPMVKEWLTHVPSCISDNRIHLQTTTSQMTILVWEEKSIEREGCWKNLTHNTKMHARILLYHHQNALQNALKCAWSESFEICQKCYRWSKNLSGFHPWEISQFFFVRYLPNLVSPRAKALLALRRWLVTLQLKWLCWH